MRASLSALAMLLLAATALPLAAAQDEQGSTGSAEAVECVSDVALLGRDDFRWYRSESAEANPRIAVTCPHVRFTITAEGQVPHNFRVEADGAPPATDVVSDGETTEYVWTPPADGSYMYLCLIHGRAMSGVVQVGEWEEPMPTRPTSPPPPPTPHPMPPHPMPSSDYGHPRAPGFLFALIPLLGPIFGFGALIAAYTGAWF